MKRLIVPVEQLSAETRDLCDVMNEGTDLACVVVGAAFIEEALGTLLGNRFIPSKVSEKLLSPGGALGPLVTRADVAYCLGLLAKQQYQDVLVIADIRNRFAHGHLQLAFEDQGIRERCERLGEWRVLLDGEDEELEAEATVQQLATRARNQFKISLVLLANQILLSALSLRHPA